MNILLCIEPGLLDNGNYVSFCRWAMLNTPESSYGAFPFRMAYTSALLRHRLPNATITLIDPFLARMNEKEFMMAALRVEPDIIIMQASFVMWNRTADMIPVLRARSGAKVVVCGHQATALPAETLRVADAIIRGEYMWAVLHLAEHYGAALPGIAYHGDSVASLGMADVKHPDELPWPDRDSLDPTRYLNFAAYRPVVQMLGSFGCPCSCTFCVDRHLMYGQSGNYRFRNVTDIVDEMIHVQHQHKARLIWFDDDTFTGDPDSTKRFCEEKIKRKVKLPFAVLADLIHPDEETIRLLAKAGCINYAFGVECSNRIMLRMMGKPVDPDKIRMGAGWLRKYGIASHATFSFGNAGETPETMRETYKYLKSLPVDSAQITVVTPYPGTPLFRLAKRSGWLRHERFEEYLGNGLPIMDLPTLPAKDLAVLVDGYIRQWSKIMVLKTAWLYMRHPTWLWSRILNEGWKLVGKVIRAFVKGGLEK